MRVAPSLLDLFKSGIFPKGLSLSPLLPCFVSSHHSINQTTHGYDILNDEINLLQKILDNKRVP